MIGNSPFNATETRFLKALAQVSVVFSILLALSPMSVAQSANLELLGSIETLNSLRIGPDDVVYSSPKDHLFITSDSGPLFGIFEITLNGTLVNYTPFPVGFTNLGFGIARSTRGSNIGHFFLPEFTGTPTIRIVELDSSLTQVNVFTFTGSASPGDSIAFNPFTTNLAVGDLPQGHGDIFEVTTSGVPVRSFSTAFQVHGLTFNVSTGTYFGVNVGDGNLYEFTEEGVLVQTFNLRNYGVMAPVGVASGAGRLFVADEGIPTNSVGVIYIFKSPSR
jgi:hypothetical protein